MTIELIIIVTVIVAFFIGHLKVKENLAKYKKENNASFAVEVEEFAKWAETIFKDYYDDVGIENAKDELTPYYTLYGKEFAKFYEDGNGFVMPKIVWDRRSHICLLKPFTGLRDPTAIENLRKRYNLPTDEEMRFDKSINGFNAPLNVYAPASEKFYSDISKILLVVVFQSLKQKGYNLGKNQISSNDAAEYQQIMSVIKRHHWLSGKFKRFG
ncbi:MAG: hypothetical protein FWE22_00875 [Firmicutes bacterium]|nr:hypothetical protein [Bacillota bacterium]